MNYSSLIEELTQSYSRQIEWYVQLKILVQKILGQITLSRGDLAGVMALFSEKQDLLDKITRERDATKSSIETWQRDKDTIPSSASTVTLDAILQETELAIKAFLDSEDQLKKYLAMIFRSGRIS